MPVAKYSDTRMLSIPTNSLMLKPMICFTVCLYYYINLFDACSTVQKLRSTSVAYLVLVTRAMTLKLQPSPMMTPTQNIRKDCNIHKRPFVFKSRRVMLPPAPRSKEESFPWQYMRDAYKSVLHSVFN